MTKLADKDPTLPRSLALFLMVISLTLIAVPSMASTSNNDMYGWFDTTTCGPGEDHYLVLNIRAADGLIINRGGVVGSPLPGTESGPYGGYPGGYWTTWFNLDDLYNDYNGNESWFVHALGTASDPASINEANTRVTCI